MRKAIKYCVSPDVIALLRKDGMGWGHDLDSGCFRAERPAKRFFKKG